jgi:5-methylcytosine-specific restriction protein B
MPPSNEEQTALFQDLFGPRRPPLGGAPLQLMHGREQGPEKCLMYWLEFKDDDESRGNRFGSIAGGLALKFGICQRAADGAWISGSLQKQRVLILEEAIALEALRFAACSVLVQ